MLTAYINAAMRSAHYDILEGGEGYIGKIPGLQGVWEMLIYSKLVATNCARCQKNGSYWALK